MHYKGWLKPEFIQITAAFAALLLGLMIYLLSRDPQQVYFLSYVPAFQQSDSNELGIFSYFLPSLLHIYAFILLTVAVLSASLTQTRIICLCWVFLECLFEIGQHKAIADHLSEFSEGIFILEVSSEYFLNGTFDIFDIVAIVMGAFLAYATVSISFSALDSSKEQYLSLW